MYKKQLEEGKFRITTKYPKSCGNSIGKMASEIRYIFGLRFVKKRRFHDLMPKAGGSYLLDFQESFVSMVKRRVLIHESVRKK